MRKTSLVFRTCTSSQLRDPPAVETFRLRRAEAAREEGLRGGRLQAEPEIANDAEDRLGRRKTQIPTSGPNYCTEKTVVS